MKKVLLSTVALMIFGLAANAQYEQGQSDINLGVGFITLGLDGEGGFPLSLSYDYMVTDDVSVGLGFGYVGTEVELLGEPVYDITYLNFALRGLYHFDFLDPLDTYAGVVLGYTSGSIEFADDEFSDLFGALNVSSIYYGVVGGIRYRFLNDQFGVFAEVGYALSPITIGLNASF